VELRANYDFENSEWEGMVFEISWPLGKEWALDCQGNYDFSSHKIESIRVGLTRDLHCREVTLFYDQSKDTFWIEYAIKAFPEHKFSLGGE
jgi:lipopolysaccharide assembly outer membrane protein LptD (OstA)